MTRDSLGIPAFLQSAARSGSGTGGEIVYALDGRLQRTPLRIFNLSRVRATAVSR